MSSEEAILLAEEEIIELVTVALVADLWFCNACSMSILCLW